MDGVFSDSYPGSQFIMKWEMSTIENVSTIKKKNVHHTNPSKQGKQVHWYADSSRKNKGLGE